MYNSSIKGQGQKAVFSRHIEIPNKIFYNDMSKNFYVNCFSECDVIFSEIAWVYGYPKFNENAGNKPNSYRDYMQNINKLIHKLNIPAFIVCGRNAKTFFKDAQMFKTGINNSGTDMQDCVLYVWNFHYEDQGKHGTKQLVDFLSEKYKKCLDFSCGYGEHLMKFKDFIGCDIDRNCLTYLSILYQERNKANGTKSY